MAREGGLLGLVLPPGNEPPKEAVTSQAPPSSSFPKLMPLMHSQHRAASRRGGAGHKAQRAHSLWRWQSGHLGWFGSGLSSPACHQAAGSGSVSSDQISPSQLQRNLQHCHPSPAGSLSPFWWKNRPKRQKAMRRRRTGETAGSGLGSARGVSLAFKEPIPQPHTVTVRGHTAVLSAAQGGVGWGCCEPPFHVAGPSSALRRAPVQPKSCAWGRLHCSQGSWLGVAGYGPKTITHSG